MFVRGIGHRLRASCRRWRRRSPRSSAPSWPTRRRSSTCSSASAARSAPPCWRSSSSARSTGVHTLSGAAHAYGTAFWASAGLTALAIIPCVDPDARRARRAGGEGRAGGGVARGAGGGDGRVSAEPRLDALRDVDASARSATPPSRSARSFKRAMAAVRRLRGRETHRPGELTDAQYGLLFGLRDQSQMSVRDLAYAADLCPASVTEMLEGLAAAGLVRASALRARPARRPHLAHRERPRAGRGAPRALRAALPRRPRRVQRRGAVVAAGRARAAARRCSRRSPTSGAPSAGSRPPTRAPRLRGGAGRA